jgi:hypothetical protein
MHLKFQGISKNGTGQINEKTLESLKPSPGKDKTIIAQRVSTGLFGYRHSMAI